MFHVLFLNNFLESVWISAGWHNNYVGMIAVSWFLILNIENSFRISYVHRRSCACHTWHSPRQCVEGSKPIDFGLEGQGSGALGQVRWPVYSRTVAEPIMKSIYRCQYLSTQHL